MATNKLWHNSDLIWTRFRYTKIPNNTNPRCDVASINVNFVLTLWVCAHVDTILACASNDTINDWGGRRRARLCKYEKQEVKIVQLLCLDTKSQRLFASWLNNLQPSPPHVFCYVFTFLRDTHVRSTASLKKTPFLVSKCGSIAVPQTTNNNIFIKGLLHHFLFLTIQCFLISCTLLFSLTFESARVI